jgi:2-amino-4-hydroxy-6-hydroxymethyldihydropteridine diphosphokinase
VKVVTPNGPIELLHELRSFELELGRKQRERWHEREIDFDILFFEDLMLQTGDLTIPHPGIPERAFVLVPMADLDRNFVHPVLKKTVGELLDGMDTSGVRKTDFTLA